MSGFFTPKSGAAAKFDNVGDTITGQISGALSERPSTYNGTPRTTKKGAPVMEIVIPLLDTQGNDRTLYVAAWRMRQAIQDAVMASGAKDVEEGGLLTVTFTGHVQGEGASPAKTFSAQYQAPGTFQAPAQQAPVQQAPQGYAPPAQSGYAPQAPQGYAQPQQGYAQPQQGYAQPQPPVQQNYAQAPQGYAPPVQNNGPAPLTN